MTAGTCEACGKLDGLTRGPECDRRLLCRYCQSAYTQAAVGDFVGAVQRGAGVPILRVVNRALQVLDAKLQLPAVQLAVVLVVGAGLLAWAYVNLLLWRWLL